MKRFTGFILLVNLLIFSQGVYSSETVKVRHVISIYADSKGNGFFMPQGVGCSENILVVSDTENNRLVRFTLNQGGTVTGGEEWKIPELVGPLSVHVNSKGGTLVLDAKNLRIAMISPIGKFEGYLEISDLSGSAEVIPMTFKLDNNDNVYILDVSGGKVLILDPSGKVRNQIPFPENYGFISDLAVDSKGVIYLLDTVNKMIYTTAKDPALFSPLSNDFSDYAKFPTSITVDNEGIIFVVDRNDGVIAIIGKNGNFIAHAAAYGWKEGQLRYPAQICINKNGFLFIADRDNNRIQIFQVIK